MGLVVLARGLRAAGRTGEARPLVEAAQRAYAWACDPERNANAGSRWGWFPESIGDPARTRVVSETCVAADMVELAAGLAAYAAADPAFAHLEVLWEDVERYARNALARAQWVDDEEGTRALADCHPTWYDKEQVRQVSWMLHGSWRDSYYPNDFATAFSSDTDPFVAATGEQVRMCVGGCCAYSGPRGIHAAWDAAATESPEGVSVNLHLSRATGSAEVAVTRAGLQQCLQVRMRRACPQTRVWRPSWLSAPVEHVTRSGSAVDAARATQGSWWVFRDLREGEEMSVSYPLARRLTEELLPPPVGYTSVEPADRIRYAVAWEGNDVVAIRPEGRYFPLFAPSAPGGVR